jgi:diguanylate cyclase (GGDEF)-like protein
MLSGSLPFLGLIYFLKLTGQYKVGAIVGFPAIVAVFSFSRPIHTIPGLDFSAFIPLISPTALGYWVGLSIPVSLFSLSCFAWLIWTQFPRQRWLLFWFAAIPVVGGLSLILKPSGLSSMDAFSLLTSLGLLLAGSVLSGGSSSSTGSLNLIDSLANQLSMAILVVDTSARILDINETGTLWSGKPRMYWKGKPLADFGRQLSKMILEARKGSIIDMDVYIDQLSPPRYCHVHIGEEVQRGLLTSARILTIEDISRFIQERETLKRDLGLLEMALSVHENGMMVTDETGRVIYRSPNLYKTFNLPDRTFNTGLIGWRNQLAQAMKDPQRFLHFLEQTIVLTSGETLDVLETTNDRWLECRTRMTTLNGENRSYRIWTFADNTEQQRREQELQRMSTHDGLTGANNRAFFEAEIRRLRLMPRFPVSMIMVDVDGLKSINDRFGHATGDEALRKIADILKHACRTDDIVARIGGDEFGLLLTHADDEVAGHVLDRIISLQNLYNIRQPNLPITVSLGHAVATNPMELDTVFQRADTMMYTLRQKRRSGTK